MFLFNFWNKNWGIALMNKRVLICDDDIDFLSIYKLSLEKADIRFVQGATADKYWG